MRELHLEEICRVAGSGAVQQQAQNCSNDMMSSGGMGATLGAIIGGAFGSVIPGFGTAAGATLGGLAGAALGGGAAAANSPNCRRIPVETSSK